MWIEISAMPWGRFAVALLLCGDASFRAPACGARRARPGPGSDRICAVDDNLLIAVGLWCESVGPRRRRAAPRTRALNHSSAVRSATLGRRFRRPVRGRPPTGRRDPAMVRPGGGASSLQASGSPRRPPPGRPPRSLGAQPRFGGPPPSSVRALRHAGRVPRASRRNPADWSWRARYAPISAGSRSLNDRLTDRRWPEERMAT
jgi:hypothetical protein